MIISSKRALPSTDGRKITDRPTESSGGDQEGGEEVEGCCVSNSFPHAAWSCPPPGVVDLFFKFSIRLPRKGEEEKRLKEMPVVS